MITVHYLENSRAQRVLWLLEELGAPYQIIHYARDPQTLLAPPSLRAVHPLGKSPVIVDGGTTVAESAVILEYLADKYGADKGLRPAAGTPERMRCDYWMHYAEGSLMPPLLLSLVFARLPKAPMPFFVKPVVRALSDKVRGSYVKPQVELHLDYLESELGGSRWFAGHGFSIADIQLSYPIAAAALRVGLGTHVRLGDWLKRCQERSAWQRAQSKGGPIHDFD